MAASWSRSWRRSTFTTTCESIISTLESNAEPILSNARAIADRADQMPRTWHWPPCPNPLNGPFYRLDDIVDGAVVKQEPPIAAEHTVVGALEFDDPSKQVKAAQAGLATSMKDGVLEVTSDPDDYLENAIELAVSR